MFSIITVKGEVTTGTVDKVEQRRVEYQESDVDRPVDVSVMDYEDWQKYISRKGLKNSNRVHLTVRRLRSFVTIEFEANNQKQFFSPPNAFDPGDVLIGQKREIVYDSENLKIVKLNDGLSFWRNVIFPGCCGKILLLLGPVN